MLSLRETCQVLGPDHPRRARASLSAFDVAAAKHTQRRHVADADEFCCRFERNLAALRPLAVAEHGDVVVIGGVIRPLGGRNADHAALIRATRCLLRTGTPSNKNLERL